MQLASIFADSQVLSLPPQKYTLMQVITVYVLKTLSLAQTPEHHHAVGTKGGNPSLKCGWDAARQEPYNCLTFLTKRIFPPVYLTDFNIH